MKEVSEEYTENDDCVTNGRTKEWEGSHGVTLEIDADNGIMHESTILTGNNGMFEGWNNRRSFPFALLVCDVSLSRINELMSRDRRVRENVFPAKFLLKNAFL